MPWKHLPRYLPLVLEYGFHIELGFDAVDLEHMARTEARRMADQIRARGSRLSLHGPFWDLSPGSPDPLIRQVTRLRFHQLFDLVPIFQPLQVVCHTGYDPRHHGGQWEQYLERSLAVWGPLAERAAVLDTPLLLENVWEDSPRYHKELFGQLGCLHVGFCLDVGHQNSFSRTPLPLWLEMLAEPLREIHLHDNDGQRDAHLPVGEGNVDFAALVTFLRGHPRPPLLTLEPHQESHLFASLNNLAAMLGASPLLAGRQEGNSH